MVEAEFHCVWASPEGDLIDLTPKIEHGDSIIFVPDPNISYTGVQIENTQEIAYQQSRCSGIYQIVS